MFLHAVVVFDMSDMGSCPGQHRGGGGIMASTKKLLAPTLPRHHDSAFWGLQESLPRAPNRPGPVPNNMADEYIFKFA